MTIYEVPKCCNYLESAGITPTVGVKIGDVSKYINSGILISSFTKKGRYIEVKKSGQSEGTKL